MANSPAAFDGRLAGGLCLQNGLQRADRLGVFLQRQQQRAVGQLGVGLELLRSATSTTGSSAASASG